MGGDGDFRALFKTLQLILKYVEADFQVLCIDNAEQCHPRNCRGIKGGIERTIPLLGKVMSVVPCTGNTTPE